VDTLVKWVVIMLFAPIVVAAAVHAFALTFVALLPYLLLVAVVIGAVMGGLVGFMLRRHITRTLGDGGQGGLPVPPPDPIHRPRGARRDH
jgi:hypothetical protein